MDIKTPWVKYTISLLVVAVVVNLVGIGYLWKINTVEKANIASLLQERESLLGSLASTTKALQSSKDTVTELAKSLSLTVEELEDIERDLDRERNRNEKFSDQIEKITGTVGKLDKLAKTDKELLQKYSKVYFLNENYTPLRLSQINKKFILAEKKDQYFHSDALPFLEDMMNDARDDDIDLYIISAYRSFDEQQETKGQFTQIYGSGANTFSADQGYSEHQLGTTVDITDIATGGTYESFSETEAYDWLTKNAYKYGFILSYPKDNGFYVYEPWHWRFVGKDLARNLNKKKQNFYDLDQREIDSYLVSLFD